MVSIYDIAKEVGVSATTVSRVINNKYASPKTRAKVLRAIKRLDYIPDARASGLKTRNNKSIGVIVSDITNPIHPVEVKAIHDVAKERGYYLILGNTYGRLDEEMEILKMMARERVAGLILATCEGEDDTACNTYLQKMINSGVSLVLTGRKRNGLEADEIVVDNAGGVYKATSYLLRTGRRKIAFMAGQHGFVAREGRFTGYLKALSEKGIARNENLISFGNWNKDSGRKQMDNFLKLPEPPDAVFCGNDLMVIGALESIENAGLNVPEDVAVIGFDDIELASLVRPRLTTVMQFQEKNSAITCNLLLDRIEQKETGEPKEILIEPELVIRESA